MTRCLECGRERENDRTEAERAYELLDLAEDRISRLREEVLILEKAIDRLGGDR